MFLQNSSFASYGPDDNLTADSEDIGRYLGKSALSVVDSILIHYTLRRALRCHNVLTDFNVNNSLPIASYALSSVER